jgi:putative aldouronate transport system permease protein
MEKQGLNQRSKADAAFDAVNAAILLALVFVTIYPMYYVLCASVSNNVELLATPVSCGIPRASRWVPIGWPCGTRCC